jgi:nitrogen fixation NifU-like protein
MADLAELYQQVIIDHNRRPRNFKQLSAPNRRAQGDNPLCGDKITLEVQLDDDVITDIGFQGSGCAISQASASLMTSAVQGKTRQEAEGLFNRVHEMLTSAVSAPVEPSSVGKLAALAGVRQFPMRVKCASLPWHTLRAALQAAAQPVSTE